MKPSEILLQIKEKPFKGWGICTSFNHLSAKLRLGLFFNSYMEANGISFNQWPEYSGSHLYPVKSYKDHICPSFMYNLSGKDDSLWDKRTKYGKARWRLLDWLIEQFQAKGQ